MKIDTSTTAGKIKVQQAWVDGKIIHFFEKPSGRVIELLDTMEPCWDWESNEYFIKPQTVEDASFNAMSNKEAFKTQGEARNFKSGFIAGSKWRDANLKDRDNE